MAAGQCEKEAGDRGAERRVLYIGCEEKGLKFSVEAAMATILRVKRRHEGEAEEALVLKRKRAKSGEEQVAAGKLRWTVAKFAGTLKDSVSKGGWRRGGETKGG